MAQGVDWILLPRVLFLLMFLVSVEVELAVDSIISRVRRTVARWVAVDYIIITAITMRRMNYP